MRARLQAALRRLTARDLVESEARARAELAALQERIDALGIGGLFADDDPPDVLASHHELTQLRARIDGLGLAEYFADPDAPDLLGSHHELAALRATIDERGLEPLFQLDSPPDVARFLTWRPPGHFYSPIPDLSTVDLDRLGVDPDGGPGLDLRPEAQLAWFDELSPYLADWAFPEAETEGWRYFGPNGHFDPVDAGILHATLRHVRPRRIVEIGSGFSTALVLDTMERFLDPVPSFTAIEPFPVVLGTRLRETDPGGPLRLLEQPIQDVDLDEFRALEAGDICFIDTTHVVKVGSDVVHLFRHVVPELAPGVLVHVHDMFWPFEYPRQWVTEGRVWQELQLVEAFLRFNDRFRIKLFVSWLTDTHAEALTGPGAAHLARFGGGGSLWLEVGP